MLESKSMPSDMAANTNDIALLKNQSAIKYKISPIYAFPLKISGVR